MVFSIGFLLSAFAVFASAAPLTYEQKVEELLQLHSLMRSQYGPYDYKKNQIKISPDGVLAKYVQLARTTDNVEFYYLVNQFVGEFKDSHFGSRLQTDRLAQLGFIVDRVDGKVLIDEINRMLLPESMFPFQRGDELTAIDMRPVSELIEELGSYLGSGYVETNRRRAAILLTFRPGANVPVSAGKASVTVRRMSGTEQTVDLDWQVTGGNIEHSQRDGLLSQTSYGQLSIFDLYENLPRTEKNFRCSGTSRINVPEGATHLMKTPFVTYYHPSSKGNIGYLRIPHYYWLNPVTGADESELRLAQYEWAIEQLEKHTVGLIIDQDHNCGGSVFFLESMVSLFLDRPFKGLEFQFLASRNEYLQFKSWISTEESATILGSDLSKVLDLMKVAYSSGDRMTQKTTFRHERPIQPNSIRYTKPVVMLIDELSGSGGDAFPAMLQGLGRAKLMGTRTMGAGGHVVEFPALNYSGNLIRMTKSLFYHPDGTAIENNGVTPQVPYTITRDDFLNGYRGYQARYLEVLAELIP